MTTYSYTAVNDSGETVTGIGKARSIDLLQKSLEGKGLTLDSANEKSSIWQLELTKRKVPPTELMHFSRQLAAFVRAGISILDALETIAAEAGNKVLREALFDVSRSIKAGRSLSVAASEHPEAFPSFYVRTLRSAELTGKLDSVLDQLSAYIERDVEAKRKIRSAMIYPGIVFGMSIVTVVVLMVFVLPRFKTFFAEFHAKLPLPTRILMTVGDFIGTWWYALLGGLVALMILLFAGLKTRRGKRTKDRVLLRIPIIGDVLRFAVIERFCRILSSLMEAAVTIPEAMEVATKGTNNIVYEEALSRARNEMIEGQGLARPIADTKLFPSTVTQMIRVGEETGTLDHQLKTAAEFFDVELGYKIKRFTTMVEPAVITLMGGIVGFVAISLVSAMYGIFHQVKV